MLHASVVLVIKKLYDKNMACLGGSKVVVKRPALFWDQLVWVCGLCELLVLSENIFFLLQKFYFLSMQQNFHILGLLQTIISIATWQSYNKLVCEIYSKSSLAHTVLKHYSVFTNTWWTLISPQVYQAYLTLYNDCSVPQPCIHAEGATWCRVRLALHHIHSYTENYTVDNVCQPVSLSILLPGCPSIWPSSLRNCGSGLESITHHL